MLNDEEVWTCEGPNLWGLWDSQFLKFTDQFPYFSSLYDNDSLYSADA
jgi:hypothetical protein